MLAKHQLDALDLLRVGSILDGRVGSGKSRAGIAFFVKICGGRFDSGNLIREEGLKDPMPLYIITTAKKRDKLEWEGELSLFGLSKEKEASWCGVEVHIDSWNNLPKYVDVQRAFFIFDEQRLVGSGAWVKTFLKLAKKNKWIMLTGTPGDTWSDYIPLFIANGFYENRTDFNTQHIIWKPFRHYPVIDRYIGTKKLEHLRSKILVRMSYAQRIPLHRHNLLCEYDRDQYMEASVGRWNRFKERPIRTSSELAYLLRRVVNSDSSRKKKTAEILEKHSRLIVFYNFTYERDALLELAEELSISVAEWNGQKHQPTPTGERWMYILQYASGSEAWECTETDAILFYSLNYSYRVITQAEGRINRMNTGFPELHYYFLKSTAPIDVAITKAIKAKKVFNEKNYCDSLSGV